MGVADAPSSRDALGSRRSLLRNVDADELIEDFLIAAVAAILGFRVVLHVTGYPSLGGAILHIAHVLPGGLLMLAALVLVLGYLGSGVKRFAAIMGGAGFGTFIDELGKFVTRDNDYFFKPTAALIYLVFVVTYVAFRVTRRRPLSPDEAAANALELLGDALRHDLDPDEKARALALLSTADRDDPAVAALDDAFRRIEPLQAVRPGITSRVKARLRARYRGLVERPRFAGAVVLFFTLYAMGTLVRSLLAVAADPGPRLSLFQWGDLLSSAAPGVFVLAGILRLPRSRLAAYLLFERAVLIQIFITQFFAFYHAEFVAVVGLAVSLLVFATLRYVVHQEEAHATSRALVSEGQI